MTVCFSFETPKTTPQHRGFTLIELIIVLAISSILVVIAYPTYQHYLTRHRRLDAQIALLDLANRMEQFYSVEKTYQSAEEHVFTANGFDEEWYTLSITSATNDSYTLAASPTPTQSFNDTVCQSLTIDNLGRKNIAPGLKGVPTGAIDQCW